MEQHFDPTKYTNSPQWQEMLLLWKNKGIQEELRKFDDEWDAYFSRMRMIAICHSHETMVRGVSERDNPSAFLA
jgi:hypothetical protein